MKSSIKANFNIADIEKIFANSTAAFDQAIFTRLELVGENFVINARTNGNYDDHTKNLRNSIRYFIIKDGELLKGDFSGKPKPVRNKNGSLAKYQPKNFERSIIEVIIKEYPKGWIIVCTAGMEYAGYVESKGKDVITTSSITAESDLKKSLEEVRNKLSGGAAPIGVFA